MEYNLISLVRFLYVILCISLSTFQVSSKAKKENISKSPIIFRSQSFDYKDDSFDIASMESRSKRTNLRDPAGRFGDNDLRTAIQARRLENIPQPAINSINTRTGGRSRVPLAPLLRMAAKNYTQDSIERENATSEDTEIIDYLRQEQGGVKLAEQNANRTSCRTTYDEVGTCKPLKECSFVRDPTRTIRTFCRWIKEIPVCCPNPTLLSEFNLPNCGTRDSYKRPIIFGGEESQLGSWPWMAGVYETLPGIENFFCGATIINSKHLVTAAHPFVNSRGMSVPTTKHSIRVGSIQINEGTKHLIDEIIVHPQFKYGQIYFDIAVFRLQEPITFTSLVRPICLPTQPYMKSKKLVDKEVTVTGWGITEDGGAVSTFLREVTVKVVNASSCDNSYKRIRGEALPRGIARHMICAGVPEGGKDACAHDSGGPLVLLENSVWVLVGVVSAGAGCGLREFPGIYTRVTSFVDWLVKVASET